MVPAPGFTIPRLLSFFLYNFFYGPASEETSWRSFALPRIPKSMNASTATLLQGALWVLGHAALGVSYILLICVFFDGEAYLPS
jgi:membrane protease YdiL (CAAX protease family)